MEYILKPTEGNGGDCEKYQQQGCPEQVIALYGIILPGGHPIPQ